MAFNAHPTFATSTMVQKAATRLRTGVRRAIGRTPLDAFEQLNARDVWRMQLGSRQNVPSLAELHQLVERLGVPMQPLLLQLVEHAWESRPGGNMSFDSFVELIEKCKTLHQRWLHKIRGKHFDDDILEAYIAVGGSADSTGEVDLSVMREVVEQFHLELPDMERSIRHDGNASPVARDTDSADGGPRPKPRASAPTDVGHLDFSSFVGLLRSERDVADSSGQFSQLYLNEFDLTEEKDKNDDLGGTLSRQGSMHRRRGSSFNRRKSMRRSTVLPPLNTAGRDGADSEPQSNTETPHNSSIPPRAHTSMEAENPASPFGGSGSHTTSKSPQPRRRAAASPPPKTRFPVLKQPKQTKKPKYANW